jgi:hypothetical protein
MITFSGEDLSPIRNLIDEIKEENRKGYGWIPKGFNSTYEHALFDVDVDDNVNEIIFECWTKWTPPLDEILFLCFGNDVNFSMQYEELGMNIYGICTYDSKTNTFEDVHLNDADFERIVEDDDTFEYTFNGEPIESRYDALEEMLKNKLKQLN